MWHFFLDFLMRKSYIIYITTQKTNYDILAVFLTFRRQTAYLIVGKFCEFCEKITTNNSLNSQNFPTEKKQSRSPTDN